MEMSQTPKLALKWFVQNGPLLKPFLALIVMAIFICVGAFWLDVVALIFFSTVMFLAFGVVLLQRYREIQRDKEILCNGMCVKGIVVSYFWGGPRLRAPTLWVAYRCEAVGKPDIHKSFYGGDPGLSRWRSYDPGDIVTVIYDRRDVTRIVVLEEAPWKIVEGSSLYSEVIRVQSKKEQKSL